MKIALTSSSDRIFGQDFFPTNSPFDFLSIEHVSEGLRGLETHPEVVYKKIRWFTKKRNNTSIPLPLKK